MSIIIAYVATLVVFLIIDIIWLTVMGPRLYFKYMGELYLEKPNMGFAVVFYAIFIVGMVYFAVQPALAADNIRIAIQNGALYGFFTYLTYNATNAATMKGWVYGVSVVDTLWGTVLGLTSATLGFIITKAILG